jgi:hypothetical protein
LAITLQAILRFWPPPSRSNAQREATAACCGEGVTFIEVVQQLEATLAAQPGVLGQTRAAK